MAVNLQQSLAGMGYDPLDWTASGEAAIAVARQEQPDLVLMDIGLAGKLSGIETARRLWHTLQIPVVYCTARADVQRAAAGSVPIPRAPRPAPAVRRRRKA